MDITKMLTRAAIRAGVLLAVVIFLINGVIAPMLPEWVAVLPVEMSIPVFVTLALGLVALDYVEKNFLKKYM